MIPFSFNENCFFFVADHLLVGQLCTNPKSDRSLLSCLKVTQGLTSEIGGAPLYNSCSLPFQVMTTGPLQHTQNVMVPWCNQVAGGRPWVWQQDSAPAHKSKETQAWLQKERYDGAYGKGMVPVPDSYRGGD